MTTRLAVKDLPATEHPRYRAQHYGVAALSNAELLQLICRVHHVDTCPSLLSRAGHLGALARMSGQEMAETEGLGEGGAAAIQAAFELGRRLMIETSPGQAQVTSLNDAANLLMGCYGDEDQEHLAVMCLDTRNRIIGVETVYKGSVNTVTVRVAEVFQAAVKRKAVSIILCHNHPSGDPTPSPEDVRLTEHVVQAGQLMDIEVLDHIVVGRGRFVSLKERGLGFS
jgi:DNA repair protein RadC